MNWRQMVTGLSRIWMDGQSSPASWRGVIAKFYEKGIPQALSNEWYASDPVTQDQKTSWGKLGFLFSALSRVHMLQNASRPIRYIN